MLALVEPVSYTHLDVYKRQPVLCPKRSLCDFIHEMFKVEFTAIRRISDYGIKAAVVNDFGEAVRFPVEHVDPKTFLFGEQPQLR